MGGWQKTGADRQRDAQVYGAEYRRSREVARRRAGGRCEGCGHKHVRLECDHIRNVASGQQPDHSPGNLRMLCKGAGTCQCHEKKTGAEGAAGAHRARRDPPAQQRTRW